MDRPRVGVGVIVKRDTDNGVEVLLGLRKGAHGEGKWAFVGGHLEYGESVLECAKRECMEEIGLNLIEPIRSNNYTESIFEGVHYITLYVIGSVNGTPIIMEPDKCTDLKWFNPLDRPKNLFEPTDAYLRRFLDELYPY